MSIQIASAEEVARRLPMRKLVDGLRDAFAAGATVPLRNVHKLEEPGRAGAFYVMPAWLPDAIGVKLATLIPDNPSRGLPTIQASVILFDRNTGAPVMVADGTEITLRRTAAASALASDYLSRADSSTLLIAGTGGLTPYFAEAHAAVRPLKRVLVWGRDPGKAKAACERIAARLGAGVRAEPVSDLAAAVAEADIVTCATASTTPVILGRWLRPGIHLDMVGAHTPTTREIDDDAVVGARVYMDTRDGCMKEAGEIIIPLANGTLRPEQIIGDLTDLARKTVAGRQSVADITIFKSVGTALEDVAAAKLLTS